MGVHMKGRLTSPITTELIHESGARITTMAPKDNGGDGSTFSPTDLFAVSLGACATTIMGLFARDKGIAHGGIEFEIEKIMGGPPRRIERLVVTFRIKGVAEERDFQRIVGAGKTCPVRITLGDAVEIIERYERE